MKKLVLLLLLGALCTSTVVAQKLSDSVTVSTFAGSGVEGNIDGIGTAASFGFPRGICADISGNIYVADSDNHKIRKITPAGVVSTLAGSGIQGNTDGTDIAASFNNPSDLCADVAGNIYVADEINHKIRKITPAGVVSTLAGSEIDGSTDGTGTTASFNRPTGLCIDVIGNIYVTDRFNHKIRKITPAGVVSTFAGSGAPGSTDATGTAASFKSVTGVCADAAGNIYVADQLNHKIRKITSTGVVTTYAGSGAPGSTDAIGTAASFNHPSGVCADASGNIYVADSDNNKIRKIQEVVPAPPVINYVDLPASVCFGSTLDKTPTTTGSAPQLTSNTSTLTITNPIFICKNDSFVFVLNSVDDGFGNFMDTIRQYDFNNNLVNTVGLFGNKNQIICADTANNIYAVYPDNSNPALSNIRRILPNGFDDFSFSIPSYVLDSILAIEIGPDGYLYATEKSTGEIKKINTSTAAVSSLPNPNPSYSFNKPVDIVFDKAGDMYLADIGLNQILKRNQADNNYYPVIPGLDTVLTGINSFDIDSVNSMFLMTSGISNAPISIFRSEAPYDLIDTTAFNSLLSPPKADKSLFINSSLSGLVVWSLNTAANQIKQVSATMYSINPALPAGLSYNFLTGQIFGKPLAPSPLTTYTITVYNNFGNTSSTISFGVDPSIGLNNSAGTSSTIGDQKDGLTVKYFSPNNCNKMIELADNLGGTKLGKVEVRETVSSLATFATGKFVGRVTEVNTQDPNASAVVRLYFTYQDIQNFNAGNGTGVDLTNDTTGGTMQVAVLQLHKNDKGVQEQIKHNPITANWITAEKNWKVEFPVTKFSTFYTGESGDITAFDCSSNGSSTTVTSCGYYFWRSKVYTASGTYKDTTANKFGCDSVLTLNLTVTNDFEISQSDEYLQCNTTNATSYQWMNCDNGGTPISGATNYDYTATANGSYAVIATYNSCTDTSLCVSVTNLAPTNPTGVQEPEAEIQSLSFYPNPSGGVFTLKGTDNCHITVYTVLGEKIIEQTGDNNNTLDISGYPAGIYFANIRNGDASKNMRLIKR